MLVAGASAAAAGAGVAPDEVAPGVYVLHGDGGSITPANEGRVANLAFVIGPQGVVVVDSGASMREGVRLIAAVQSVTRQPIRLLILTHAGQEVVFGAGAFQDRGIPVLMHRDAAALMASRCDGCLTRLRQTLGEQTMAGSRVVTPDRLVTHGIALDLIGRRLALLAPGSPKGIGMLAVLDERTQTLIAGGLVSIDHVPDMRDTGGQGWSDALGALAQTKCSTLVPAFGRVGDCSDIAAMSRYFAALDARVRDLLAHGVGLAELPSRCDLPAFARWDGYDDLHVQNANRAYLRLEHDLFLN
ncbi:MAG TPA: MBL fold metallo-hydrolase [Casimicrobiaceae bacterium]|jgi:glyoxylase-like metal-dependent hydrolase (beta-lactamase superfamily II)